MVQQSIVLIDAAGRRTSPAAMPGGLAGRAPHDKGMQYPPRPAARGGDHLGHAPGRSGSAWAARAGVDRRAVTRGRRWSATAARRELRQLAVEAGVRRRFAPHQLRHAHAVELAREGVAVNIIQRQLGHSDLGTTSTYLQGIDPSEIIGAVRLRRQPTISATASLNL